ncbi:hypothetical protein [Microbacterium sp. 10M-3C3]|jgi:hypothetical protein|uniref:hypothetical protein n=1 Tax=Microbacterium sp. 10M-3C3 TaxID=2483401 RepID=UPI000F637072|nr:hypothetical protein [Microbacterium sp. 10M-3C3]
MILLALIAALSVLAVVGTVVAVLRDGYRACRTDVLRAPDRPAAAPAGVADAAPAGVAAAAAVADAAAARAAIDAAAARRIQAERRDTPAAALRARRVA